MKNWPATPELLAREAASPMERADWRGTGPGRVDGCAPALTTKGEIPADLSTTPNRHIFRAALLDLAPAPPRSSSITALKGEDRLQAQLVARIWFGVRYQDWACGVFSIQNTIPLRRHHEDDHVPKVVGARLKLMGLLGGAPDLCLVWWTGTQHPGIGFMETKLEVASGQYRLAEDRGTLRAKPPLVGRRTQLQPRQRTFQRLCRAGGVLHGTYWSLEGGLEILRAWRAIPGPPIDNHGLREGRLEGA